MRMFWLSMVRSTDPRPDLWASRKKHRRPARIAERRGKRSQSGRDAGDDARADRSATLTNGEAKLRVHRDRHDQFDVHRLVVAWHHHLGAFRQLHDTGHVGGAEV